jgi:hypothetical protein
MNKATPHECADRWCRCTQYEAVAGGRDCTCGHEVIGHRHYTDRRRTVSVEEARARITNLKEFRTPRDSMKGTPGGADTFGHLPGPYHEEVRDAEYVVYSYLTPIAWVTADGQRVIPDVGYSPTTGQHQYTVKYAWQEAGYVGSTFPVRGRELRPAGGGPRGGGMDEPYGRRSAAPREDDWNGSVDSFRMRANVESPDLDTPWHLRAPARGASYPPMGERQG